MGEIDAAGEVITGALLGRAVEPKAGEGQGTNHDGHGHDGLCLNCGTALIGPHCHRCGQAAHIHRDLHSIGHDLLHGVFHFEGKIWNTLPMLVTRPGELTRRYIHGERARFVSPLALFLFSVFLMFAAFSWTSMGNWMHEDGGEAVEVRLNTDQAETSAGDKGLGKFNAKMNEAKARIDAKIAEAQAKGEGTRALEIQKFAYEQQIRRAANNKDRPRGVPGLLRALGKELEEKGYKKVGHKLQNPDLLLYKLKSSMYKFSWLLIPISIPFVWLLFFWKRQYKVYDHAIFVIYSLSFMSFLFITVAVISLVPPLAWIEPWLVFLGPPVHMFLQLRGAYQLRKRSALWRTVMLLFFSQLAFTIFLVLLVALGLLG